MNSTDKREVRMLSLSPLIEEVLAAGGTVEITVTGNSMYPMLKNRQSQVRLTAPGEIHIGDIPLYRRDNGSYILHRIVGMDGENCICCGDHQWHLEMGIRHDQIIAVVTDFKRSSKWVSCKNTKYSWYWRFWIRIRPLRRLVCGGLFRIKRLLAKTMKKE